MVLNSIVKLFVSILKPILTRKIYLKVRNLYYHFKQKKTNPRKIIKNKKEIFTTSLYKSMGIKSIEEFYKDKYCGQSMGNFLKHYPMAKYHIGYVKIMWIYNNIKPGSTVLDIGCGNGHLAVLQNKKIKKLVGVDITESYLEEALKGGYDEVYKADAISLPFEDNTFDYVVSLDFFGHIEAKLKNKVISEIVRVLKKNGTALHGIEEEKINYKKLTRGQKKDILQDGHVGLETKEEIKKRFKRYFKKVYASEALGPCHDWNDYIKYSKHFPSDFINYIKNFNARDIEVFSIALGYVHNYLFERNLIDTECFIFLRADRPVK